MCRRNEQHHLFHLVNPFPPFLFFIWFMLVGYNCRKDCAILVYNVFDETMMCCTLFSFYWWCDGSIWVTGFCFLCLLLFRGCIGWTSFTFVLLCMKTSVTFVLLCMKLVYYNTSGPLHPGKCPDSNREKCRNEHTTNIAKGMKVWMSKQWLNQ